MGRAPANKRKRSPISLLVPLSFARVSPSLALRALADLHGVPALVCADCLHP